MLAADEGKVLSDGEVWLAPGELQKTRVLGAHADESRFADGPQVNRTADEERVPLASFTIPTAE